MTNVVKAICATCKLDQSECRCWEICECGARYRAGATCRNPVHGGVEGFSFEGADAPHRGVGIVNSGYAVPVRPNFRSVRWQKHKARMRDAIWAELSADPFWTLDSVARGIGVSPTTVAKYIKKIKADVMAQRALAASKHAADPAEPAGITDAGAAESVSLPA